MPFRIAPLEGAEPFRQPVIASNRVRYVGEPVAILIARSQAQAEDAAEQVIVSIDEIEPVATVEQAQAASSLLFEEQGTNIASRYRSGRGDIDAAYVWDPALAQIKQSGHVLITSGELSKQGKPTFDGIAVDRKWGEANADFMAKFVKVIADADAAYRQNHAAWTPASPQVKAIVKMIGGKPEDVPGALSLYAFPSAQQQASSEWLGGGKDSRAAKALKDTAEFLKGQQKINAVKADYTPYVTSRYVDAALKLK